MGLVEFATRHNPDVLLVGEPTLTCQTVLVTELCFIATTDSEGGGCRWNRHLSDLPHRQYVECKAVKFHMALSGYSWCLLVSLLKRRFCMVT